ncbi:MAG: phosphotransferase [Rhizonema sp. PD38]|nr:phosphotransferase [Rhizonema sp. PD38]
MGIFLAHLHQYNQQFTPPLGFVRPRFDEEGLLRTPIIPIESNWPVSQSDRAVLEAAGKKIRASMQYLSQEDDLFGLIHGDLHCANCKFYRGKIQVFDFDDSGWGYYLYDLAVTLYYLRHRSGYVVLRKVLLDSYQQIRSLPKQYESCLEALIAARRLHLLRDLLQRQDNPKLRALTPKYIQDSVTDMGKFLEIIADRR